MSEGLKNTRRKHHLRSLPFTPTSSKAHSLTFTERRTWNVVNNYATNANEEELTIFSSLSFASAHSPPRDTAYILKCRYADHEPTYKPLLTLDRAWGGFGGQGASPTAVKSSLERQDSSEGFESEIPPDATGVSSRVEESASSGLLEGLEEDCDEAAGWLSDGSCRGFFDFLEVEVLAWAGLNESPSSGKLSSE